MHSCYDRKTLEYILEGKLCKSDRIRYQKTCNKGCLYMTERIKRFGSVLLVCAMVLSMAAYGIVPVRAEDTAAQTSFVYEAENYYSGNISEGQAADMQPGERIEIALNTNAAFVAGKYVLTVKSCGNRTSFEILVNGESVGTISRTGTSFGMNEMTADKLDVTLELKPEDVVTIVAPADGYGWVDYIQLDAAQEAVETPAGITYEAENYYSGNISEGVAADMQPGQKIEIALNSNSAFAAGKYALTVKSCGNRTSFEVLVNGQSVGSISRSGTGFGLDQMTEDRLDTVLELGAEDVLFIVAPADGYGWVDSLRLDPVTEKLPARLTYQAENYYSGNISEGQAADMQPGEKIEFALNTNADFVPGKYMLTVRSCGNRESFEILVNGQSVGTIRRGGTGFGMDAMTSDSLSSAVELKAEDVITIVAPDSAYGWVDYIQLDEVIGDEPQLPAGATETGDGYYIYQIEYFYSGNISENVAADMQPNEKIEVALNANRDFAAHKYILAVKSCGNRTSLEILVNGESVGTITREGTSFGQDQMTEDSLTAELELKAEDVVTIVAPADGYGWVDCLKLTMVHSYTDKASENKATEANCVDAATYYVRCDHCDVVSDSITVPVGEPLGHNAVKTEAKEANCTENGNIEYWYCDVCKKYYSDEACTAEITTDVIIPAGHVDEDGNSICDRCESSMCEQCVDVDTDNDHKCDVCGTVLTTEHAWDEGSVTTEATCTEDGEKTYTCNCGEIKTEKIPAPGHTMTGIPEVKPTPTAGGNNAYYHCESCGRYFKDDKGETETTVEAETLEKLPATETGDGYYLYQIEYYYAGNISEGIAADMQPNEMIDVALNSNPDFVAGKYVLTVRSCGNRESIDILVNGQGVGAVSRTGTGFGQDQMTDDKLAVSVELKPEDVITLVAPDGCYYGWVDYLKLTPDTGEEEPDTPVVPDVPDNATEVGNGYLIYQTEYFYTGKTVEGVAADLQPGESIHIHLNTNPGFAAGTYTLSIRSCGNRESFTIQVNGQNVGSVTRTGTGFGQDQMTYAKLMTVLNLKDGDVLTLVAPGGSYYGWVDFIVLDKGDTTSSNPQKPENNNQKPATGNATETGDGYFIYQAEAIYTKMPNTGDPAADLQPGESIDFKLSANKDFTAGTYTLSIRSCGNREQFTVKLNGEAIDVVSRTGTEFGMDQMTDDKLMVPLELKPEDTLTITAQSGSYWGWVDFIVLDVGDTTKEGQPVGEATEVGDGYYLYQAEFFYNKVSEGVAADLQPGTVINMPLNACEGFQAGWYTITVASCGTRETIYLRVNDKSIGSIARLESGYGMDEMSEDRYKVKVELGPDDVLTLSAPNDGTYGWVDYVRLDAVEPPANAKDDDQATEPTETEATEPVEEPVEKADNTLPVVIVAVVAILIACGVAAAVLGKKKKT